MKELLYVLLLVSSIAMSDEQFVSVATASEDDYINLDSRDLIFVRLDQAHKACVEFGAKDEQLFKCVEAKMENYQGTE